MVNNSTVWQRIDDADLLQLEIFASNIAKQVKIGDVITLTGDLGTGKTTFVQFFIRKLTEKDAIEVTSPTFNLLHLYDSKYGEIWHFDLYRLKKKQEIYELGIEDAFMKGISLIEWPEIIADILPASRLEINLEFSANNSKRNIIWRHLI